MVLLDIKILQPSVLKLPWLASKYNSWWQRSSVCAYTGKDRNPLSVAVLMRTNQLAVLYRRLREHPPCLRSEASKEAFFVHIVGIRRLNLILVNLALREVVIPLVGLFVISLKTLLVNGLKITAGEDVLVALIKPAGPAVTRLLSAYLTREVVQHCNNRW